MPDGKINGTMKVALTGVLGIVSAVVVCMAFLSDVKEDVRANTEGRMTVQRRLDRIESKIDRLTEFVMQTWGDR